MRKEGSSKEGFIISVIICCAIVLVVIYLVRTSMSNKAFNNKCWDSRGIIVDDVCFDSKSILFRK